MREGVVSYPIEIRDFHYTIYAPYQELGTNDVTQLAGGRRSSS